MDRKGKEAPEAAENELEMEDQGAVSEPDGDGREEKELPLEKMSKSQLIQKLKEFQNDAARNYDLFLRSQADFENLKKRFQKERGELLRFSNESLIKQLLTVLDNLEQAIHHAEQESSFEGLLEGVRLTSKGMMDILAKAGLKEIKALQEPFDPNFHEAVFEKEDDSVAPGTVAQELQKGYMLHDRLIRPAMVGVSKKGV
jgi:molecular chaperone GrpE